MTPGLRELLEALREGQPLEPGTVAQVGRAALAEAMPSELAEALFRRLGLEGTRSRLVLLHGDGLAEDLIPDGRT